MSENKRPPPSSNLSVLSQGGITLEGRIARSSNAAFLVSCSLDDKQMYAVYKPIRGERPLWDFPDGLARREAAAFELSEFLGWQCVPETIVRTDGPFGSGSLQRFVDADFSQHYFTLIEESTHHSQLRRLAIFDLLANNADRKSGHCLVDPAGQIWGIDNGLCFHVDNKLRTVIWDFACEEISEDMLVDIERLTKSASGPLGQLLNPLEVSSLCSRAEFLLKEPRLPMPSADSQCYPWPLV